jgi:hypothetical protein
MRAGAFAFGLSVVVPAAILCAAPADPTDDPAIAQLFSPSYTQAQVEQAVEAIRQNLQANPQNAVDRLNERWMQGLLDSYQYNAVSELAIAGTLALPADTWRIEQLQKHRITALLRQDKPKEALAVAKGLFNMCGLGFVKDELPLLADCLKAAHPDDPRIVPQWKLQVLAGAQEDPAERKRLLEKYGGNSVMDAIPADPDPYVKAIAERRNITDYRGLYGTGNLLLLSGRTKEARQVFDKVYAIAPPGELKYATEGIAKCLKAEDGGLGRANQFVISIRPQK